MSIRKIQSTLEEVFNHFNKVKFNGELPEPVITIQSKGKTKSYGWCSAIPFWNKLKTKDEDKEELLYEINISAEHLDRGINDIIETLLHECCHLYANAKDIIDCNSKGFHNEKFKEIAEMVGLKVDKIPRKGFALTSLTNSLKQEIEELNIDPNIFCICRIENIQANNIKKSSQITMKCQCGKKLKVKEEMNLICGECGSNFVVIE